MTEFRYEKHEYGWEWRWKVPKGKRISQGIPQVRRSIEVDPDCHSDVELFIDAIREAATGMEDPSVGMETEYGSYGNRDRDRLCVKGWADATVAEVDVKQRELDEEKRQASQWQDRQIENLRKQRPELFK